jgi:hypothetical protein
MIVVMPQPPLKGEGDYIIQKEKSYVVDYHCNSSHPVAARLSRSEHQSKVPTNRRLDSHSDRYRRHTRHIAPHWGGVNLSHSDS